MRYLQHVAIDVIGQSEDYRRYVSTLVNSPKYDFDTNNQEFQNLYRDVVLKLKERGYLFDDDPEFISILQMMKDLPPLESAVTQGNQLESINISTEDIIPALHPGNFNPIQIKNDAPAPAPQDDQDFVALRPYFETVD